MRNYKPRRQSKRWLDGDCPAGVLAILDHPKFGDRYTVVYAEPIAGATYANSTFGYVGMSAHPFHPQGIGQHGEFTAPQLAGYRYSNRHHKARWSDLPDECKRLVLLDLKA